jgi:hypothetical protein
MNKSNGSNNSNRSNSNGNNRSNGSKSNNNNRSSGNRSNNSRFNFVNEEIQANKAKENKEKTSEKPKEIKEKPIEIKEKPIEIKEKPIEKPKENMFTNSRFSMSRLMEDYPALPKRPESESTIRTILTQPRPVAPVLQVKIPAKDEFPTLSTAKNQIKDDFPTLATSNVVKSEPAKINFKKAINTVDNVVIEEKQFVPKPGWVYFIKNKAGKTELVYGPKSIEQKRNEYQNKSWNYQMYLAISNMESRWASEKQLYNIIRGENAYQSRYDNTTSYNSDNDSDMDETDVNTTDDDSDYETE